MNWQREQFCEINFCVYANLRNLFQIFGTSIKAKEKGQFYFNVIYVIIVVPNYNQKEGIYIAAESWIKNKSLYVVAKSWIKNKSYHLKFLDILLSVTGWLNDNLMDAAQKLIWKSLSSLESWQSALNWQKSGLLFFEVRESDI